MPCQHHWLIESPNGPTCRGRCKRCGEEREFQNSNDKFNWVQDRIARDASHAAHKVAMASIGYESLSAGVIEVGYKE